MEIVCSPGVSFKPIMALRITTTPVSPAILFFASFEPSSFTVSSKRLFTVFPSTFIVQPVS